MQMRCCIIIGVPSFPGTLSADVAWEIVTGDVTKVSGFAVIWVSCSLSHDEGRPVQLLCAVTDADVDDVVSATSVAITRVLGYHCSCELWASAPAILPLRPLGGYNQYFLCDKQTFSNPSPVSREEWATSTMKEWGMFVQPGLIDAHEVEDLRQYVYAEIASIEKLIQHLRPDIVIGKDIFQFKEIASRGNQRFDLLLPPESKAQNFVERIIVGRISSILEEVLDGCINNDIEFDISVVYSKPGAPHQGWHADGDHQRGAKDAGWEVDGWKGHLSKPYALCLFIPLINLGDDTGYTQFWPASHRNRGVMGFGSVAEIAEATWDGKCNAGDAIWYDYRLMHRGMSNASHVVRPVLQVLFRKSWYAEKRNYGTESLRKIGSG